MATEITAQEAFDNILGHLKDRPHAQAYREDAHSGWTVVVFNGQGDEAYAVSDLDDEAFAKIRPICLTINENDEGSLDNPAYDATLLD